MLQTQTAAKTKHCSNYLERLINKKGESNLNRIQIERKSRSYFFDLFNTVVDLNWPWILVWFALSFALSWLLFAILWYYLPDKCVIDSENSFAEALMFSIETQQTIGYGVRSLSNECPLAVCILALQCTFAVLLESMMGGIVFVKLSRPKKRTETLIFSRNAVLAVRDSQLCLMCRLGDMRRTHITCALAKMFLVQTRITREGEIIPWNAQELDISFNSQTSDRLLFMPIIIEHKINGSSPMHDLIAPSYLKAASHYTTNSFSSSSTSSSSSAKRRPFLYDDFEIVVVLEGTIESTGQTTQARTSYLPSEILCDRVFEPIACIYENRATIDFSKFHLTKPIGSLRKIDRKDALKYLSKQSETDLNNNSLSYFEFELKEDDEENEEQSEHDNCTNLNELMHSSDRIATRSNNRLNVKLKKRRKRSSENFLLSSHSQMRNNDKNANVNINSNGTFTV